jgi:hypothetical protein
VQLEKIYGRPLTLNEKQILEAKINTDAEKGPFAKDVPSIFFDLIFKAVDDEELDKTIVQFIHRTSPFYIDESGNVKFKSGLEESNPLRVLDLSEKYKDALYSKSKFFKDKNNYYEDFENIRKNLFEQASALRKVLKLTEDYSNVDTIIGEYLHSTTAISKIGAKIPLYREIKNDDGTTTKDVFMVVSGTGEYSDWD